MLAKKLLTMTARHWQKCFLWQLVARKRTRLVAFGVKTRWFDKARRDIERNIIVTRKNFA